MQRAVPRAPAVPGDEGPCRARRGEAGDGRGRSAAGARVGGSVQGERGAGPERALGEAGGGCRPCTHGRRSGNEVRVHPPPPLRASSKPRWRACVLSSQQRSAWAAAASTWTSQPWSWGTAQERRRAARAAGRWGVAASCPSGAACSCSSRRWQGDPARSVRGWAGGARRGGGGHLHASDGALSHPCAVRSGTPRHAGRGRLAGQCWRQGVNGAGCNDWATRPGSRRASERLPALVRVTNSAVHSVSSPGTPTSLDRIHCAGVAAAALEEVEGLTQQNAALREALEAARQELFDAYKQVGGLGGRASGGAVRRTLPLNRERAPHALFARINTCSLASPASWPSWKWPRMRWCS